jgi:hypothetical protein
MTTSNDVRREQRRKGPRAARKLIVPAIAVLIATVVGGSLAVSRAFDGGWDGPYAIGLWGDMPYSDTQAQTGVPNLIADMNSQNLAFTAHDGDLKAGNGTTGSVTPTHVRRCTLYAGPRFLQFAKSARDFHARRQ